MMRATRLSLALLLAAPIPVHARTWHVPSAECPTVQAGIDSASVGDRVLVTAGTYTGAGNKDLDFGGTDLVLVSKAGPELTITDCQGSGRGFHFHGGGTGAAVNEGFTIRDGKVEYGGGMHCYFASPTVINCTFSGNEANEGGGVTVDGDSYPLIENTFIASGHSGEAIFCLGEGVLTLTCCDVYGNAGGDRVGCIADQLGINGNFSACPSFCNAFAEPFDFHLCDESPCAPGNHPDGYDWGLIGGWPVGCSCRPRRAEGTTWGAIKAMYR